MGDNSNWHSSGWDHTLVSGSLYADDDKGDGLVAVGDSVGGILLVNRHSDVDALIDFLLKYSTKHTASSSDLLRGAGKVSDAE